MNYKNCSNIPIKIKYFLSFAVLILFIFALGSCKQNLASPAESGLNSRIWIKADFEKFEKLMKERENFKGGTPFEIIDLKRDGNKIKIYIEGNCDIEAYKVYWDGKINFNDPKTANLIVSHEPEVIVNCFAIAKFTLEVDLFTLIGKEYDPNMRVKVSNASNTTDFYIDKNGNVNKEILPKLTNNKIIPEPGEYQSFKFSGKASQGFVYNKETNFWEWGYKSNEWIEKSPFGKILFDGNGNYNLIDLKKIGTCEQEPFKKIIFTNYLNEFASQGYYYETKDSCFLVINMLSPTISGPTLFKKKKQ
jgi:hypothetical protein